MDLKTLSQQAAFISVDLIRLIGCGNLEWEDKGIFSYHTMLEINFPGAIILTVAP